MLDAGTTALGSSVASLFPRCEPRAVGWKAVIADCGVAVRPLCSGLAHLAFQVMGTRVLLAQVTESRCGGNEALHDEDQDLTTWLRVTPLKKQMSVLQKLRLRRDGERRPGMSLQGLCAALRVPFRGVRKEVLRGQLAGALRREAALPGDGFATADAIAAWLGTMPLRAQLDYLWSLPLQKRSEWKSGMSLESWCAALHVPFKAGMKEDIRSELASMLRDISALPVTGLGSAETLSTWLRDMPRELLWLWLQRLPLRRRSERKPGMSLESWSRVLGVPFKGTTKETLKVQLAAALRADTARIGETVGPSSLSPVLSRGPREVQCRGPKRRRMEEQAAVLS